LRDGKALRLLEYRDSKRHPVFYFHSFPGQRLQASDFHQIAKVHRYCFLRLYLPGIRLSIFNKKHTILNWSQDIVALANHLGIDKLFYNLLLRRSTICYGLHLYDSRMFGRCCDCFWIRFFIDENKAKNDV
jgi:pimeloyl-ACP methyl ester carboxylesterase